jgi:RNase P/RNase MRP subunit p29
MFKSPDCKGLTSTSSETSVGIYSVLPEPRETKPSECQALTLEQFLQQRGGELALKSFAVKVGNKALPLSKDEVAPWKKMRKLPKPKTIMKWGPPRAVTSTLKAKKKGLRFDFEKLQPLRQLWLEKMHDQFPGKALNDQLSRMELVGAHVMIFAASCTSIIGKEGTIVRETANTLELVGADNRLKTIPKTQTKFTVLVRGQLWTFNGADLVNRQI